MYIAFFTGSIRTYLHAVIEGDGMSTVKAQLDNCQFLLNRAQLAGNDDAIRQLSERRLTLVRQLASIRTHLHLV
ncbi:hypothetical protein C7T36_21770 [Rhodococcus sp. AD45-ID]|nr:hypothetical protein SZ00_03276 [Rhodococcus sp. AD45]PSR40219.1 hypothetical protein C7T36_21770 [Rhodococcus sp. AD45-ID]